MSGADVCLLRQVQLGERIHTFFNSVPKEPIQGLLKARLENFISNYTKLQAQNVQLSSLHHQLSHFLKSSYQDFHNLYRVVKFVTSIHVYL